MVAVEDVGCGDWIGWDVVLASPRQHVLLTMHAAWSYMWDVVAMSRNGWRAWLLLLCADGDAVMLVRETKDNKSDA